MVRRTWIVLLTSAIAAVGCAEPAPDPKVVVSSEQRREQVREQLRSNLGAAYDQPLPVSTNDDIRHGSKLYDLLCRACHGPTGTGAGRSARMLPIKPPNLTDPETARFFSDRAKLEIIASGIEGTPMIGWSDMLQREERLAVLHFMNTLVRESREP